MEISGINQELSEGKHKVAFDVTSPLDPAILSLMKKEDWGKFSGSENVLILESTFQPIPLNQSNIVDFLNRYNSIESAMNAKAEKAHRARMTLLQEISDQLGYPLSPAKSSE